MTVLQTILQLVRFKVIAVVIVLAFAAEVLTEKDQPCTTPDGQGGKCVLLTSCPILTKFIRNPIGEIHEYLNESRCDEEGNIKICCPTSLNSTIFSNETSNNKTAKTPLGDSNCGYRTQDVRSTSELPWLGSITAFGWTFCSCTLINARYVLTSARCASSNFLGNSEETGVMLLFGGLHYNSSNPDCTKDGYCTQLEILGFEEYVAHPFHEQEKLYDGNDIGLIRLNRTVTYTDNIRPICLPTSKSPLPEVGTTLYTSGWGVYPDPETGRERIKHKVSNTVLSKKQCENKFKMCLGPYPIPEDSMCLSNVGIGLLAELGTPVMNPYNDQLYLEGIGFSSRDSCEHEPLLYTKVLPYLDWIESNMRPWT